jgi:hypothetical protein
MMRDENYMGRMGQAYCHGEACAGSRPFLLYYVFWPSIHAYNAKSQVENCCTSAKNLTTIQYLPSKFESMIF